MIYHWKNKNGGIDVKESSISENAIKKLLEEYAENKAQVKLIINEMGIDQLKENPELMYYSGFCKCAERRML